MDIMYDELIAAACTNSDLKKAVHEAELDHLAYGRSDFYLDFGPDHKSLASVQKAGRGWLYVTYCNTSVYLQLTSDGKLVCEHLHNKEDAVVIAALARVFVLSNYAINHREVVNVFKQHRKNTYQEAADIMLDKQKSIPKKRIVYKYASKNPNGKKAWENLGLVPVKTRRRGHYRRCSNGKNVWVQEAVVTVYRKWVNAVVCSPDPKTPKELLK